ncbi:MAG: hypothetical protein AMXMBFR33_68670 [Candidatus Xenobia bacterium]
MLIQSVGGVYQSSWRPQNAPIANVGGALPTDSVQVSAILPTTSAPLSLAAQAVSSAAQAAPAPAAARPALEELRQAAERLQKKGARLEHRPKILFFTLDFRESSPDKAAKLADKPERVRVQRPNFEQPIPLTRSEDMLLLDAFYGKADVSQLERPEQAAALLALEKAHPGKVDAYQCYLGDKISLNIGGNFVMSLDEALALAYLEGHVSSTSGLQRPEHAESLHRLERAGFELKKAPLQAYRDAGYRYQTTAVYQDGQVLAEFDERQLADIPKVLEQAHEMSRVWRQLSALGEQAPAALACVRGESAQRFDLKTRVDLAHSVFAHPERAREVYDAACGTAADASELEVWVALARRLAPTTRERELAFSLGQLKTLVPPGQLPSEDTVKEFQLFLKTTRSPDLAAQCLKALAAHPEQPESPERFYPPLLKACQNEPKTAARAFEVLASAGRLEQDQSLLESMLASVRHPSVAIEAYPTLASVPEEQRGLYLELWKQAPGCSMKEAWQAVSRSDEQLTGVRARAWSRGVKLLFEQQMGRDIDRFSQLLARLPDGPDLAQRADLLERVVRGSQGSLHTAEAVWKDFQSSSDIDTAVRFYEATGRQDEAARAAEILTRTDLSGAHPYEACRDSLALLIGALGGKVTEGLEAYRHLLAVSGDDLLATARDYASLIKACGQDAQARIALGACRNSPPRADSATTAESLALALQVHGDLAKARPLWESLERVDKAYPREQRVKNVQTVLKSNKKERSEVLALMERIRLDDRGRELTGKLLADNRPDCLALIEQLASPGPQREPLVSAWEKLAGRCHNLPELLQTMAPHCLKADFGQLVEAVLRLGSDAGAARIEQLLAARQPGEDLRPLASLLRQSGEGFQARRQALQEGTVEGRGLEGNTRWFVSTLERSDLKTAEAAWELVRRPVGGESTSERQAAFDRLSGGRPHEVSLQAWKAVTRWMQPGETLPEAVEAALAIRAKLSESRLGDGSWTELLGAIRQRQMSGELEHLPLSKVAGRVEKAIATASSEALLDSKKKLSLETLLANLCEQVAGSQGIQTGEHHVVVGGVRVATR